MKLSLDIEVVLTVALRNRNHDRDICTSDFIAALFTIAKEYGANLGCPSTNV